MKGGDSEDAFTRFDDIPYIRVIFVKVRSGKGMRLNPGIDIPAQFSQLDIFIKPVNVVPVPKNGQIDVAFRVIDIFRIGSVKIQTPDGDVAPLKCLNVILYLLVSWMSPELPRNYPVTVHSVIFILRLELRGCGIS